VSTSSDIFSSWWHDVVQWGRYFLLFLEYWCLSLGAQKRNMPSLAVRVCSMKLTSASWLRPVCSGFYNLICFNCAHFFASYRRHRVLLLHVLTHAGVRPTLENCWGSAVVSCCSEKLVTEAGDSSETQRMGKSAVGSRYQKTGDDTADWEDLRVCSSELWSVWISEIIIITCSCRSVRVQ
jgi:hypothetical protein